MGQVVTEKPKDSMNIREALAQAWGEIQRKYEGEFISTGFEQLDRVTAGLRPGELLVIGGRPMSGKTALAIGVALHVAIKEKKGVAYFSTESSAKYVASRMAAAVGKVPLDFLHDPSGRWNRSSCGDEGWAALVNSAEMLREAQIWIDEVTALTPEIMWAAEHLRDVGLIVVDNLQQLRVPELLGNPLAETRAVMRSLHALARETGAIVIATSHLMRPGIDAESQGRAPALADLGGDGLIEGIADTVLLLDWKQESKETLEVIVAKQRSGPIGSATLKFDKKCASVYDGGAFFR